MRKLPIIAALLAFATIFAFQNCSTSSMPNLNDSSVTSTSVAQPLTLYVLNHTMAPNDTQTISGLGGTPPYTYSVDSGGCTIDPSLGLLTANANGGVTCVVRVADTKSQFMTDSILVSAAQTTTTTPVVTAPVCTDITYADPQGIHAAWGQNGSTSFTSDFSSQLAAIPTGCKLATVTVSLYRAGNLGGSCGQAYTYPALSVGGSASAGFINGGGSGNKTQYGTAQVSASSVLLTEISSGWGDAGGYSTAACISNVRLLLHVVAQ